MADIQVANSDDDLSGNTLLTEEEAYTITGLHTYNRSTNPPFAVVSGAAKVDNLDADKLDGVEGAEFLKRDGTVALTANWDAGGYEIRSNTFESDVATGTAPLVVASTTKVANLNADKLDDQEGSYYLAAANATGTLSVAQGGTGATSLTDNAILMGNGTSAVTPGSGLYGYDSTAALRIEGADPYLSLKETTNTKEWKIQVVDDSSESLIQIPTPTGGTTTDWIRRTWYNGATDYRASTPDNIRLFNADGTSERLRLGTSGVSFDAGSNYLDDYEEGTYTPYLYGATTGNTGDSTYRITGTTGNYCKIGRLVFVHFRFDDFTVPTNATGHLSITVPFTCNLADVGGAPMMNLMNISTNCTYSIVYCNSDHFRVYSIGDDVAWSLNNITDTSGGGRYLWASFTYYTNS